MNARCSAWVNAGVGPEEIDLTGSYDAFTFTTMLQLDRLGGGFVRNDPNLNDRFCTIAIGKPLRP